MNDEIVSFNDCFDIIIDVLKRYLVMEKKYYIITALWIIGTYFHKNFKTYPYLYFNASKSSGKTRILKLISFLSKNGRLIGLPSEAYVFRTAETNTFCMDELEGIDRKESQNLRLLLNSAYKRGMFIPRIKKGKDNELEPEEFEAYAPIILANIYGMNDVLQDRCITVILERINLPPITKKIEAWEDEDDVKGAKKWLESVNYIKNVVNAPAGANAPPSLRENAPDINFGVVRCNVEMGFKCIEKIWNDALDNMIIKEETTHNYTITTNNTTTFNYTNNFEQAIGSLDWQSGKYQVELTKELLDFFKKIYDSGIDGRNLELYLPLFIIASMVSLDVFDTTIQTATTEIKEKVMDEIMENRDAMMIAALVEFLSEKEPNSWITTSEIKTAMILVVGEEKETKDGSHKVAPEWLNVRWIGWAIKRMNLAAKKRRRSMGVEVVLDFNKIRERAKVLGIDVIEPPINEFLKKEVNRL